MKHRIAGLDGLRAIAVAMVFVNHKLPIGQKILPGGYGVHLFFVLSGFLIIGILAGRREAIGRGETSFRTELVRFYANRLYRIWPIYYLTIAIVVVMGVLGVWRMPTSTEVLALVTFTSNIFQGYVWTDYPEHFGPLWSVAVEEQFYLWSAPVFLLCRPRHFWLVCIVVMVVALVAGFSREALGALPRSNYVGPLTNFGLMALGGMAAVSRWRPAGLATAAPFALLLYIACPVIGWLIGREQPISVLLFWASPLLVCVTILGLVIDGGWLARVLEFRPIRYFGRISYGFYLYHGLLSMNEIVGPTSTGARTTAVIDFVLAFAASALSWHLIEQPLLRMRDRRRARATERLAQAVPVHPLQPAETA